MTRSIHSIHLHPSTQAGGGPSRQQHGEPWGGGVSPSKNAAAARPSSFPDSPALGYLQALSISSGLCLLGTWISATVFQGAISSLPVISLLAVCICMCSVCCCVVWGIGWVGPWTVYAEQRARDAVYTAPLPQSSP